MIETYSPLSSRVKTHQVVADTVPEFALTENPLLEDFLEQYYISQEFQGGVVDIAENIDKYIRIDNLTRDVIHGEVALASSISATETEIGIGTFSTKGFPNQWGLLKVDDEIITYSGLTTNSFTGCVRGFSGITTYRKINDPSNLEWSQSVAGEHTESSKVQNLSALFLTEIYTNLKSMYTPGLEGVPLSPELDVVNFVKEARSLYESKGTDESFKILFKALFGIEPKINDLEKYLIKPSYANYLRRESFAVELVSGDPEKLIGQTLFQDNEINNPNINAASGPISEVVQIRDNYYRLSVFIGYDERALIQGTFIVPGRTQVIGQVGLGATVLTVDSTIGFGQTGSFEVGQVSDSHYQKLDYSEKTVNQFIGVTTTSIDIPSTTNVFTPTVVYGFEDNDLTKRVNMRITAVLREFDSNQDLFGLNPESRIKVKNLGRFITNPRLTKTYEQVFFNSWIYNTSARYEISDLTGSTFTLTGIIYDSSLKIGDSIELLVRNTETVQASNLTVSYVNIPNNSINVSGTFTTVEGLSYDVRRVQSKATSSIVPIIGGQNQILTDIGNTYIVDKNKTESTKAEAYVAANSLPSYQIDSDKIHSILIDPTVSGGNFQGYNTLTDKFTIISFTNPVPFRTGDEIVYIPSSGSDPIAGLDRNSYFVEVLSPSNQIKLYQSRSFIPSGIAQEFVAPKTSGTHDFVSVEQARRSIFPGRKLKKYILEQDLTVGREQRTTSDRTLSGNTGMLINGVEIRNYKSDKSIFFGPLKALDVVNSGTNYDVLNPPLLTIEDNTTGVNTAFARVSIAGTITGIQIDPVEFEIKKVVSVDIHGGNGKGAKAQAVTELNYRTFEFNAKSFYDGGTIDPVDNRFILNKNHFYQTGDRVIYNPNNNNPVGLATTANVGIDTCLVENQSYYIGITSSTIFQIYRSKADSVAGVNTVGFNTDAVNLNSGIHAFRDFETKRRISRVTVLDGGEGYANRKISVLPAGISTARDFIQFDNHGFKDGEVVHYGISSTGGTVISGLSTTAQYQVLTIDTDKFRLCESGVATARVPNTTNYSNKEYIRFGDSGSDYQDFFYPPVTVDLNVITNLDSQLTLNVTPIVRGTITDTIMYDRGLNYGSDIINFEKAPSVSIRSGRFGQIGLTIINGRILDAFVQSGGIDYDGPPDISVVGAGTAFGAELRAVMDGDSIGSVIVISSGIGYTAGGTTVSVKSPGDAATFSTRVRRLSTNQYATSGTTNGEYLGPVEDGLAVESIGYGKTIRESFNDNGGGHSPIIGWAYDGIPIYGPYGFDDIDDIQSSSRKLLTSYKLDSTRVYNRPSTADWPAGSFIEDYYYDTSGDLDEHNGRFAKTPDFPNGIYAYYASVDVNNDPQYPYYIGDTFRGSPIRINTVAGEKIKQTTFDFENSKLVRNTFPYKMFGEGAGYDFVYQPYNFVSQVARPDKLQTGPITGVRIASVGTGYSVGSNVIFDNSDTGGTGASAYIERLSGKTINKITTEFLNYENTVFKWRADRVTGYIQPSHDLKLKDDIVIAGLSTAVDKLNGSHIINQIEFSTKLLDDGFVGVVTDIRVQSIPASISIGSTIGFGTTAGIGSETAKVLNVYHDDGVLRIRRSVGVATTGQLGIGVSFVPDQYEVLVRTDYFESDPDEKVFFNPSEAVGFGTTVGQTITKAYQYLGVTADRSILTQSIFLENHGFKTNDTLEFSIPSGGTNISVATSAIYAGTFTLPSTVYAVRKTDDTIGLKTTKSSNELHFISGGSDAYDYLLEKQYTQVTGKTQRITGTIQTSESHELEDDDRIDLIVKPGLTTGIGTTSSVALKILDDYLIVNPLNVAASGINTSTNRITSINHGLITGDRVYYYGSNLPGGVEQREYYVIKIDDDTLQIADTLKQAIAKKPEVIDFTSTGSGGWSINPINPQIRPFKNNTLNFDLSHPSMSGYDLKFFYDTNFFNEFVGSGTSLGFEVVGVTTLATVGIASTAIDSDGHPTVKLNYSDNIKTLYYNVFGPSGLSTADRTVINGSEIKYVDSNYNGTHSVISIGNTEFTFNLKSSPESLQYKNSDCEILEYDTQSSNATGGISTVNLVSGGFGYSKLPGISSISGNGINATLIPESTIINRLEEMRVPEDVYGYPSDNTLKPDAFIPRIIDIDNFATIGQVNVLFGGKFYVNAPSLALYDKATGEILDNGLITCELSDSAVVSAKVSVSPVGLSNNDFGIAPIRNSNGISIMSVQTDVGVLTCKISTPVLGYDEEPFAIGDAVLVEGITFDAGSGDGYNSGDYKFAPFTVTDYNDAVNPRQVTFDLNGISTNPGTGATVSFGFGQLVKNDFVARFEAIKIDSTFITNEPFKKNNKADADIQLDFIDGNSARIVVSGAEPIEVTDVLSGKLSGSEARVVQITEFDGSFNLSSSVKTLVGWRDNIGIINDTNQVLPDNDYYQNMSYAIESPKTYEDLINYVNDIVHPTGLKNFANTEIVTEGTPGDFIQPAEDAGGLVLDFIGDPMRLDSIYPYDLARDFLSVGNISKFVELRNTRLSDFILNKTNRVLNLDDISSQFVSNESNDLSDFRVVAQYPAGRYFQRFLTQTVFKAEDPRKNHYQINEFISITLDQDTFLMQKAELKNFDQVGLGTGYAEFDTRYDAGVSKTRLIFRPNEPFDTDYEVKSLQTNFADSVGVGTTAFGHIRLDGGLVQAGAASTLGVSSTTNIIGVTTTSMKAALVQFLAIDNPGAGSSATKQVDYLEYAVMHDGTDTYLTELGAFNTKQNLSGLSAPEFIGTFSSEIDSGVLKLNFENGRQRNVNVKFKTIAIDPSAVGVNTNYRFKIPFTPDGTERTGRLEVTSQAKAGISTIVGIASIRDLSVKSTVHVAIGETQSIHQIYLLSDPEKSQSFISEYAVAAIGSTTGVGTFGSTYRTDGHLNLEFHPSVSGIVSITAYNEILYKEKDPNGTLDGVGELNYGQVYESVSQNTYLGINNRDIKSFDLTYKGVPVYARETNISDPSQINYGFGRFEQEHFFMNFEQLSYKADSNLIGIAGTGLVYYTGVGTARLPETVYCIKDNNRQFRLALSESDARAGFAVTFVPDSGAGNQHRISMRKRDSKSMLSLSGLVQKPISYTSISYELDVPVAGFVTAFVLSGISSITSGDLLKIEDEYSIVKTVGFGTTTIGPAVGIGTWTLVEVERGAVGTAATPHAAGETVRLFRGSFQILDSQVHFTQAPLGGDTGILNPNNLPFARATFGGRTFLRNDYSKNQLFDDLSESFDGLETTYPLTSIGAAVTGIGTTGGNGVLFINNIFQAPFSENNVNANFKIIENAGIASVQFTGISSFGFTDPIIDIGDINENQLPRGGIIISVASTPGRGYAPFVGAKVRPVINSAGNIIDIVGVPTSGHKIGISTATYNNINGIIEISTDCDHGFLIGDPVKLEGLEFACTGYGNTLGITSFVYDHISGIATIITDAAHGFTDPSQVAITTDGLTFTCEMDGQYTNHTYPRAGDPADNKFLEVRNVTTDTFDVFVGITTNVGFTPTNAIYDANAGIMTMTIPNHNIVAGTSIKIKDNSLFFKCDMDGNSQTKSYPRITDPVFDTAISVASTTATGIAITVGTSPIVNYSITTATYTPTTGFLDLNIGQHGLATGTNIKLKEGGLIFRCNTDSYISTHTYPRNIIDTQTVNGATYDANAGIMTVTVVPGGRLLGDGDWIKFDNDSISFKCDMDGGTSTKTYPRASDPVSGKWLPITGITTTSFSVDVGKSTAEPFSISSAIYDPTAGIVTATIGDHNFMTGVSIRLSPESFAFRCGLDTYQSLHYYPRSTDTVGYNTAVSIASTTADSISFQVLASQPSTNISTHHFVPNTGLTAETGTQYDGTVGIMTVTSANHNLSNGDWVRFETGSVTFTCAKDNYCTTHAYPRETDPYSGKWTQVSHVTTNTFRVNIGVSPDKSDHIFSSGIASGITRSQIVGGGPYTHTFQAAGVGSMDQKRDQAFDAPIGIHSVGSTSHTATNAVYDPNVGIMTVTVAGHGFMNSDRVKFDTGAISLKCSRDGYRIAHAYPRVSDPVHAKWVSIASTTVDTFAVDVGKSGPNDQYEHIFSSATTGGIKKQTGYVTLQVGVSTDTSEHRYDIMAGHEASNAVITGGGYAHSFQSALTGAVVRGGNYAHTFVSAASSTIYIDSWSGAALTPTNAVYNPTSGVLQITAENHGLVNPSNFKLSGIGVTCVYGAKTYPSGVQGYFYTVRNVTNSTKFTTSVGISTVAHQYVSGGEVRIGITTNIFPDYDEELDITGIVSTKTFRVNAGVSTIPHYYVTGGTAAPWYNLTFGSGYNQLMGELEVCTHDYGGIGTDASITATIGIGGTLIYHIGSGGTNYSDTASLDVGDPNGSDLSIIGKYREGIGSTTLTGVGASITVDIIGVSTTYVGMSTSPEFSLNQVYIWKMTKFGYGFKKGDKFELAGLSTDPKAGDLFEPFEIEVIDIFNDDISAWQFGNIDYIDNIKPFQDGDRLRYPLYYQDQLVSFEIDNNDPDSREIDLAPVLMIFVNGILQEPNVHYTFNGGTSVSFETAPTVEDDVFIFFYRGTVGNDSVLFDVNEVIKIGDSLELFKSEELELNRVAVDASNFAQQEERIAVNITSASVLETPFYQGSGVNPDNFKPFRWNKQKEDKIFGGALVSKARDTLEAQIVPTANVLSGYAATATELFVDHVERFRDLDGQLTGDFGLYVFGVGIGTTATAGVNWEVWNDIDPLNTDVQGYTGVVTGITTSAGIGTDLGLVFQLDMNALVNSQNAAYVQEFQEGYPFKLFASGINPAAGVITSVDSHDSDSIGISTFELDNIYYAHGLHWDGSARTGVITCNIHSGTDVTGLVGVGSTAFPAARFTWGRFSSATRNVGYPLALTVKGLDYNPDLDNYPVVKRTNTGLRNTGALGKTL